MIFVDTGALLGRYLTRDQFHSEAVRVWAELAQTGEDLATSNFVLDEFLTLLARRAGYDFAAQRAQIIYSSAALLILRPEPADEHLAIEFFKKYADQRISFTDCVSFALMRRERIQRVFTFDQHFAWAGFTVSP